MGSIGIYKSAPIEKRIKIARDLEDFWHAAGLSCKYAKERNWKTFLSRGVKETRYGGIKQKQTHIIFQRK